MVLTVNRWQQSDLRCSFQLSRVEIHQIALIAALNMLGLLVVMALVLTKPLVSAQGGPLDRWVPDAAKVCQMLQQTRYWSLDGSEPWRKLEYHVQEPCLCGCTYPENWALSRRRAGVYGLDPTSSGPTTPLNSLVRGRSS